MASSWVGLTRTRNQELGSQWLGRNRIRFHCHHPSAREHAPQSRWPRHLTEAQADNYTHAGIATVGGSKRQLEDFPAPGMKETHVHRSLESR